MTMIIIGLLYIIGVILAYGKLMAAYYEIEEEMIDILPVTPWWKEWGSGIVTIFMLMFSWISLIAVFCASRGRYTKYLFKWSYKPLEKHYAELQRKQSLFR